MPKIKFILIGIHSDRIEHVDSFLKNKALKVVAICNTDVSTHQELKMLFPGVEIYQNYKKAIDQNGADAVFVSLPHSVHSEVVSYAMRKNIHIFKEKPFAFNLIEANKLMNLSKSSKSKLMIVSQRRFHPSYTRAKELIQNIGKIHLINAEYSFNKAPSGWRTRRKMSGGGVIIDSGYHIIDLLNYYFGLPESVYCRTSMVFKKPNHNTEDNAVIIETFNNGMIATIVFSRLSQKKEKIVMYGEKGLLEVSNSKLTVKNYQKKFQKDYYFQKNWNQAFRKQLNYFTQSILKDKSISPSFSQGYQNMLVIDGCYSSFNNSKKVLIDRLAFN